MIAREHDVLNLLLANHAIENFQDLFGMVPVIVALPAERSTATRRRNHPRPRKLMRLRDEVCRYNEFGSEAFDECQPLRLAFRVEISAG